MKKKVISILLTAAMLCTVLTGCGDTNSQGSTTPGSQSGTPAVGGDTNNTAGGGKCGTFYGWLGCFQEDLCLFMG